MVKSGNYQGVYSLGTREQEGCQGKKEREEHSTNIDKHVAVFAHTEGVRIVRVIYGDFFRCTKRRSKRKGCRDVVEAVIVVDRMETTMKENVIHNTEVSCPICQNPAKKRQTMSQGSVCAS